MIQLSAQYWMVSSAADDSAAGSFEVSFETARGDTTPSPDPADTVRLPIVERPIERAAFA